MVHQSAIHSEYSESTSPKGSSKSSKQSKSLKCSKKIDSVFELFRLNHIKLPIRKRPKKKSNLNNSIRSSNLNRSLRLNQIDQLRTVLRMSKRSIETNYVSPEALKDRIKVVIELPSGETVKVAAHLTATGADILRYVLDHLECSARMTYLFGLSIRAGSEYQFIADTELVVDCDRLPVSSEEALELSLRFKFDPRTFSEEWLTKSDLLRKQAYGQLRGDLLRGEMNIDVKDLDRIAELLALIVISERIELDQNYVEFESFLSKEMVDWLQIGNNREQLTKLLIRAVEQHRNLSVREAQRLFIRSAPTLLYVHSIFLEENDLKSFALLAVTNQGLCVCSRKYSDEQFWQIRTKFVIKWSHIGSISVSTNPGRYFAVQVKPINQNEKAVKYKFYCKGNRQKTQSLLYLSEQHYKRFENESELERFYLDWALNAPIRPLTLNGTEPPEMVIADPEAIRKDRMMLTDNFRLVTKTPSDLAVSLTQQMIQTREITVNQRKYSIPGKNLVRVTLYRNSATRGLGLKLCRGNGDAVLVQSLVADGPAERTGQIEPGDEILSIDGSSLTGLTYVESVCLLRDSVSDPIYLVLAKRSEASSNPSDETTTEIAPVVRSERRKQDPNRSSMSSFEVVLQKNIRGLGFAVGSCSGGALVVKKVFGSEPAQQAGLREGDLLIGANDMPMRGMNSAQAVQLLHSLPTQVRLLVARPFGRAPTSTTSLISQHNGAATSTNLSDRETPDNDDNGSEVDISRRPEEFCDRDHQHLISDQFDVTLTKKDGSLGFTILKKEDGGVFVKDILREPASSAEPPIEPGSRILLVNGVDVSSLSHNGAIQFLRSLPDRVTLRLERPVLQLDETDNAEWRSQNELADGERDGKRRSSKQLRHEAQMMLREKSTDSLSRLKLRNKSKAKLSTSEPSTPDQDRSNNNITTLVIGGNDNQNQNQMSDNRNHRSFQSDSTTGSESSGADAVATEDLNNNNGPDPLDELDLSTDSLPPVIRSGHEYRIYLTESAKKQPRTRSASDRDQDMAEVGDEADMSLAEPDSSFTEERRPSNFTKWRGANLLDNFSDSHDGQEQDLPTSPTSDLTSGLESEKAATPDSRTLRLVQSDAQDSGFGGDGDSKFSSAAPSLEKSESAALTRQKLDRKTGEPSIVDIVLDRGWYSRLGLIIGEDPDPPRSDVPRCCVVKALFPNSVADLDRRVRVGFKLISVNGEPMTDRPAKDVIDHLRKIRGKIQFKFLVPGPRQSDL